MLANAANAIVTSDEMLLFYGPPGAGKTWAAILAFSEKRKLVLDIDRKFLASVKSLDFDRSKVDVWTPTATLGGTEIGIHRDVRTDKRGNVIAGTEGYVPDNPQGYLETVTFLNSLLAQPNLPYDVVILDTLTTLVEHMVALILYHHKVSSFTLPLWGVYRHNMIQLKSGLTQLPCTKIVIAHATTIEDETTKEVHVRPSIQGSYREEIAKDFTEVYYFLGDKNGKRMIQTAGDRKYIARTSLKLAKEVPLDEALSQLR